MYPALAVLQAIGNEANPVLWVGGEGGMEAELVKRTGVPFTTIPAAGVHGVGLRALPGNLWQLGRGALAARRVLRQFRPDVLFFTGGYVAVPMALAGSRCPSALYVPDVEPGLALKVLARFADRIALTTADSRAYFGARAASVTGYPTRPDLGAWQKAGALQALGLTAELPVLLVSGGSKGARSINRAVLSVLPQLLGVAQVVHLSGSLDWAEVQAAQAGLPAALAGRYHAHAYLHEEMGAALAAADLAISRSGASTLGELPLFGLPAVLVPYPYAWRYQRVNADFLAHHGAAIVIEDGQLAAQLLATVQALLNDPQRLGAMQVAMRSLARPQAALEIAAVIKDLAAHGARRE